EPARLEHHDAPIVCPCFVKQRQRDYRRLPRARRRHEHRARMRAKGLAQLRKNLVYGQIRKRERAEMLHPRNVGLRSPARVCTSGAPRARCGIVTDSSSAPGIATGGVPGNDTADPDALALGVDIGGTKIAVALVDGAGRVRDQVRIPTQPELGAAVTLARAREAALRWRGEALAAVGVSVAGQVLSDGTVAGAPNLGWVN